MKYLFSFLVVSALFFSENSINAEEKNNNKIIIESNDLMKFSKSSIKLSQGKTYELVLKNIGKLPKAAMGHNLIILDQGNDAIAFGAKLITDYGATAVNDWRPVKAGNKVLAQTKMLGPNESDTIKIKFDKKGSYHFICSFPGHFAQMRGIIVVD
jgi:azurin|tara:strand:+ start:50 stop:514 length:465 start_codon:yes stop_codon:yes gene_type:complete